MDEQEVPWPRLVTSIALGRGACLQSARVADAHPTLEFVVVRSCACAAPKKIFYLQNKKEKGYKLYHCHRPSSRNFISGRYFQGMGQPSLREEKKMMQIFKPEHQNIRKIMISEAGVKNMLTWGNFHPSHVGPLWFY
jgi:hypothetical protein